MSIANQVIPSENFRGHRPCDQPARAAWGHGPVSARKRISRAVSKLAPLPRSATVPVLHACLPLKTVNDLNHGINSRTAAIIRSKRIEKEKNVTWFVLKTLAPLPPLPWTVTLTRCGPNKRRMDDDGLSASLKHVRDAVAECGGVDDGNTEQIRFDYEQQYDAGGYSVLVRLEEREGEA